MPNLVLVEYPNIAFRGDFPAIAERIRQIDPGISTSVIIDRRYRFGRLRLALAPTMVFCPTRMERFRPLRGAVFQGQPLSKSEEYERLDRIGVPVPRWKRLTHPDLSGWGPYVVVKPDHGGKGANVKIMKRGRAQERNDPHRLVQEFVYTGEWPSSYRVTTLFGQFLWSWKVEASHQRDPLPDAGAFGHLEGDRGVCIVSSSKGCRFVPCHDAGIIAFGERCHTAFPDIPLLGVDVLRDARDGRLWVSEVNASGWLWHNCSDKGRNIQREFGFSLEREFHGLEKAAHILAAKTREAAR